MEISHSHIKQTSLIKIYVHVSTHPRRQGPRNRERIQKPKSIWRVEALSGFGVLVFLPSFYMLSLDKEEWAEWFTVHDQGLPNTCPGRSGKVGKEALPHLCPG